MADIGYVYALHNTYMPYLLKVGRTTKNPEDRAIELSRPTGVPWQFSVVFKAEFYCHCRAEKMIHNHFDLFRAPCGSEFFILTLSDFVDGFSKIKFRDVNDSKSPILISAEITGLGKELIINQKKGRIL